MSSCFRAFFICNTPSEQVWDERYEGLSNTLEVHVMELRRELEAHGPRLIHTLRGKGYRYGEDSPKDA